MKPITYEVVVYDDGTSAVSLFDRNGDTGALTYVGRDFNDQDQTAEILRVIRARGVVGRQPSGQSV